MRPGRQVSQDDPRSVGVTSRRWMVLALVLLFSGGCTVGPDYVTPEVKVNESWLEGGDSSLVDQQAQEIEWWKSFDDPVLDALVEEAHAQNLSLQIAAVRVLQSMAQRGIAVGELFPQTQEIGASFTRDKLSEHPPQPVRYLNTWFLGFDAAWELDVWGKYRRSIESADAELDASLASYDDVMVTLISEVAASYVQIRTLQELVAIAEENVEIQEESFRLAESRHRNGATSELDVAQARTVLEQTRAAVPRLRASLRQEMYRLDLLLGSPPRDLRERLGAGRIPVPPSMVAVGIPSDLLRRRPDIRVAERQAAAQCARIGVAEAELYPSFSLSGSLGLQSDTSGDLFDTPSWTGFFSPGIRWPVLNYGRLENEVRVQDAGFQAAILNYRNTVLAAASEVESNLASFLAAKEQVRHLALSLESAGRSLELATIRYKEGSSTFTRVLNSQSQLRQVQEQLANTQGQLATDLIAAQKALGGGWEIRQAAPLISADVRTEMEQRTGWGDVLELPAEEPGETPRDRTSGTNDASEVGGEQQTEDGER